ncbi:hypothetical protein [Nocardia seriolae]|uniref:Uncharacterized protein n=1 Tax=Nocardia seriolae TaxID=37332 RepID=A0ABC9YST3_9NOCA|nr:hypothetical protein [Nocardia seriolae]APA96097.1 hypothetical protein NS506_02030 [Nocardia seriolae]MTJ65822.1 hypothetical protein [Nocardia seriolae]MTJ75820.1 hypothetical protein [Nocardia seriolae]MTJ86246.1 hypothetical protein [Nocardia seriolae]MTK30242.1 hypothetical protein [Nocardia seriolae]
MGAFSTSPLRASMRTPAESAGTAEPAAPGTLRMSAILARVVAWLIFLGGLTGAVLGLAGLRVEITVAGLILACTAGLVLLKLRADAHAG